MGLASALKWSKNHTNNEGSLHHTKTYGEEQICWLVSQQQRVFHLTVQRDDFFLENECLVLRKESCLPASKKRGRSPPFISEKGSPGFRIKAEVQICTPYLTSTQTILQQTKHPKSLDGMTEEFPALFINSIHEPATIASPPQSRRSFLKATMPR